MLNLHSAMCQLTGNRQIDHQHAALVALLGRLERALEQGDRIDTGEAVAFLLAYVIEHFAHEEQLLEAASWPGLARHRDLHADLVKHIDQLVAAHHAGDSGLGIAAAELLSNWLIGHINAADQEWAQEIVQPAATLTGGA